MKAKSKITSKEKIKESAKVKDNTKSKVKVDTKEKSQPTPKDKFEIKWLSKPEAHDYPASLAYLRLIYTDVVAEKMVAELKAAPISFFKAKDIFRASQLSLLGISNSHVKSNRNKIKKGVKLSPIILLRDSVNGKVVIADGYHRLCAVYSYSEDISIPCQIL